jgi:hypothetical protein
MPDTNETMLEKTFSDLAYTTLRDRASPLLDYLIGFQMLKQEEEGRRAVGIFGFEIDGKVYYGPVFFLNGEVRGLDSLYSVDGDLFVPLVESWINAIINKRQLEVGKVDTRSGNERGVRVPSYVRLKTLPSSHGTVNLKLAADHMLAARDYDDVIDVPEALRQAGAVTLFKEAMAKHPRLREAVEQFYDMMDFTQPQAQEKKAAETRPVTLINSVTAEGVDALTDEQRKTIMEGGVAVIDKRPEVNKSVLYATEARRVLENPTEGGLYDVLWADGSVEPAFVMPTTDALPTFFVMRLSDGKHCEIDGRQIYTLRQYSKAEYAKQLDEAGKVPSDVTPGDVAVFASYDGVCSEGFCIRQKDSGLNGTVVLTPQDVYYCKSNGLFRSSPIGYSEAPSRNRWRRPNPNDRVESIIVGGFGSKEPIYTGNKLVVNDKGFRAIIVNRAKFLSKETYVQEEYTENKPDVQLAETDFGDYDTVIRQLQKSAQEVVTWRTDNQINIRDQRGTAVLNKTAAIAHLIFNHGLSESDARLVVDGVRNDTQTYYVKYASSFEGFQQFPPDDIDQTYGNEMTAYMPGQVPISVQSVQTPRDNREFYMYQSPFAGGGHEGNGINNPLSEVMQAASTGQKEVFDASVLGSLLKSHAPVELVDRFMPTIVTGMDRLGRILFLLMWHYDEFEERYGENDLSELLDNLKSTFNNLGEVVMFLKKRTLAGDPDAYGVGVGESNIAGDV